MNHTEKFNIAMLGTIGISLMTVFLVEILKEDM